MASKVPADKGLYNKKRTARSCFRSLIAFALRREGKLLREIGADFSVSYERARQLAHKGERLMGHPSRANVRLEDAIDSYRWAIVDDD